MHVALRVLPGKGKDLLYEQAGLWAVDAPSPCLAPPSALPSLKGPESGRSWRWAQWSGLPSTVRSQFSALGDWANVASSLHWQSLLGFSQVPEALALWKPTERWSLAQGNELLSASMKYTGCSTWTRGGSQGVMSSSHGPSSLPDILYLLPRLKIIIGNIYWGLSPQRHHL